jgi:hypothetical protein
MDSCSAKVESGDGGRDAEGPEKLVEHQNIVGAKFFGAISRNHRVKFVSDPG